MLAPVMPVDYDRSRIEKYIYAGLLTNICTSIRHVGDKKVRFLYLNVDRLFVKY